MNLFKNMGFKLLAVAVAFMLWGVSHSTSSVEQGFDLPVALSGVPDNLVVTDQTSGAVNIRVRGSRAALRRLPVGDLFYEVDLSGTQLGVTSHVVETETLDLPRGLQVVSRSPAGIEFTAARRGRRAVPLKADLAGEVAEGFVLEGVEIEPPRVWVSGPRSEVLRLGEILTETVEVDGLQAPVERTVRPSLVGRHLWLENDQDITVRVRIRPEVSETPEASEGEKQG